MAKPGAKQSMITGGVYVKKTPLIFWVWREGARCVIYFDHNWSILPRKAMIYWIITYSEAFYY
jgi:hypothetical protein